MALDITKPIKSVTLNGEDWSIKETPSVSKTVTPSSEQQTVTPPDGMLLNSVTVMGDADLLSENIKKGVDIFGVVGTFDNSDGYYYERVVEAKVTPQMFGGTKMEVCTWTPTSDGSIPTTTISHSLGKSPFLVIMYTMDIDNYANSNYPNFFVAWKGSGGVPTTDALNGTQASSSYGKSSNEYVSVGQDYQTLKFTSTSDSIKFEYYHTNYKPQTRANAKYYLILVA